MPLIVVYARLVVEVSEPRKRFLAAGDEGEFASFEEWLNISLKANKIRVLDVADVNSRDEQGQ
jgi:hypothetical protein